jgi:hypothetical protein
MAQTQANVGEGASQLMQNKSRTNVCLHAHHKVKQMSTGTDINALLPKENTTSFNSP